MKKLLIVLLVATANVCWGAASFAEFDARAKAGERLTVCFFGGSLTWSANASEPNRTGFRGVMADYFVTKYPQAHFTFVDASIGGTGSDLGLFRVERDVLNFKPDLVFLDFSCNDGGENRKILRTCCYEHLLRQMIGAGVPVVQMFFTFKAWAAHGAPYEANNCHPRLIDYRKLVEYYGTAVGDVYRDSLIPALDRGEILSNRAAAIEKVWPIDGGHPDDIGYKYFAQAGIVGYERAVVQAKVCSVPAVPLFGDVSQVERRTVPLCEGWSRALTYRTSAWYDGLSSRWMDGVTVSKGAPLKFTMRGNYLGFFGEGDDNALKCDVICDGKKVTTFDFSPHVLGARLFVWRTVALDNNVANANAEHTIELVPQASTNAKAELHIASICTAAIKPVRATTLEAQASDALEALDHARGK